MDDDDDDDDKCYYKKEFCIKFTLMCKCVRVRKEVGKRD